MQLGKMKQLIIFMLLVINITSNAQQTTKGKWIINNGINATIDKSLVSRVLFITNNRATYLSQNNQLDLTANYRFGHVTPIGRPRTSLENDLFLQAENHFLTKYKIFPSVMVGFENSKHLRLLKDRLVAGAGPSISLIKKPNNNMLLSIYGIYDESNFTASNYKVVRVMPALRGFANFGKLNIAYNASYGIAVNDNANYRARVFVKPGYKLGKNININLMYDMWTENIAEGTQPKEISTLTFGFAYTNQ
jgi:hypothetical protein